MAQHYSNLNLRNPDGSGRGQLRHFRANVARTFSGRARHDGAEHQHIWIDTCVALDDGDDYAGNVFVAIRVTDGGIGEDIPVQEGNPIELQGDWIPAAEAYPSRDDPDLPVLHFTHAPVGFVVYEGRRYE